MRRTIFAALALAPALVLAACGGGGTAVASTPIALAPAEATTIDEKALTIAAKGVSAAAQSVSALVKLGAITPGSPAALRLGRALDQARDAVNAAELARQSLSASSYTEALGRADSAVDAVRAILAELGS